MLIKKTKKEMEKITVIASSEHLATTIKERLNFILKEDDKNLILIHGIFRPRQTVADWTAFSIAKEYAQNPNNIVILLSFEKEVYLLNNNEDFAGIMMLPNVSLLILWI